MNPDQINFLLAEFHELRAEIDSLLSTNRDSIQYALLISAVVWAWAFTRKRNESVPKALCLIPPVISILLWIRTACITVKIKMIGGYIATVEAQLQLPPKIGWETTLRQGNYPWRAEFADVALWVVIVLANLAASFYYWRNRSAKQGHDE